MNQTEGKSVRDLQSAIREVRIAYAERSDVIAELRDTERARLTLLAEALSGVFDDLPAGSDEFSLAVLPGNPPRFWVDATSFVMLARDKRTYRFLKDTRLGRTVLAETTDVESVADSVTRYVAERIVERDQALESAWVLSRPVEPGEPVSVAGRAESRGIVWGFVGFGLGMLAGIFLLMVYARLTAF
ncbi:hypothetical protein [Propylenella binzhouense]|uniref:Uncharacterized protein n=1 Tax=Propylenella binzhouense TaxID=2555902 RepID=A0A964T1I8_9HYPH|nr:hypothetical protein [Propylenella binzhouense]MYZ46721.1 hypothetical protein [Propylenella binzhouense]